MLRINKTYSNNIIKPKDREDLIVNIIWKRLDNNPEEIDLDDVDVSHLSDLSDLFNGTQYATCSNIKIIKCNTWDTSKCTNMSFMFNDCENLRIIEGIEHWDVGNVTTMEMMFRRCTHLNRLYIDKWDVSNVNDMEKMFYGCKNIRVIKGINDWDVKNLKHAKLMFGRCERLQYSNPRGKETINTSNWNNLSKYEIDMSGMFDGCIYLNQ